MNDGMNEIEAVKVDICIIGAGAGGLSVAAGAAQLGLKTVLVERGVMGGDCLNTGCVPSKALLAAASRAQAHRKSDIIGIKAHEPEIDFAAVKDYVASVIRAIEPNDSQERFERLGVTVIRQTARFIGADLVQAGEHKIKARYFVIATGSRPALPQISGLDPDKIYTNETIFTLREKPEHLLVIGGGPIGIEMAQAHRRLGCRVSVFEAGNILPRDDVKNVEFLRNALRAEGVALYEKTAITKVRHKDGRGSIEFEHNGKQEEINGSDILIATGRVPYIEGLDLDAAGVAYNQRGIIVDQHLRTSNKRIFSVGDVTGGPQFTHVAGYHVGIIIRQICFKMFWAKVDYKALPWVSYTDPELAQVGLTEAAARAEFGDDVQVSAWPFAENDRAIAAGQTNGQIRVVMSKKGRILGASIVGAQAGELIGLWALAMTKNLKIGDVAAMMAPYPTLGEISKRAAGAWFAPRLFSGKTRRIVALLKKIPI